MTRGPFDHRRHRYLATWERYRNFLAFGGKTPSTRRLVDYIDAALAAGAARSAEFREERYGLRGKEAS